MSLIRRGSGGRSAIKYCITFFTWFNTTKFLAIVIVVILTGIGGFSANAQVSGQLLNNSTYTITNIQFAFVSASGTIITHPASTISVNDSTPYQLNFSTGDTLQVSYMMNGVSYSGKTAPDPVEPQPAMRVDAGGHLWERHWLQWSMVF